MEFLPIVLDGFLKLLNTLQIFFFTPIKEITAHLPAALLGSDSNFASFLETVLTFFSKIKFLTLLSRLTPFELFFGGGLIIVLLIKLVLFLIPVAD